MDELFGVAVLAPGVAANRIGEGLVFVDSERNSVYAYGGSAGLFLDALVGDSDQVARTADMPGFEAQLAATKAEWIEKRLIVSRDDPLSEKRFPAALPKGRETPRTRWAGEWTYSVGPLAVRLAEQHPKGVPILRNLFQYFEETTRAPDIAIEVLHPFEFEAVLLVDGAEVARSNDYGIILGAVYQQILMRLHPGTDWLAFLHSSAVRLDDRTVALLGPSGSGKSTLAAWLSARGFDYVADDLLGVAAPGLAVPWPMPLSIKQGSWPVIGSVHAALYETPTYRTKGTSAKLLRASDAAWAAAPTSLAALVFPKFVSGEAISTRALTPFDALVRLLNDRAWIGYPVTAAGVQRIYEWLTAIPAVEMRFGRTIDAEDEIRRLLGCSAKVEA